MIGRLELEIGKLIVICDKDWFNLIKIWLKNMDLYKNFIEM